ncbi:serine peptidase, family S28 [Aspergillus sp. HF37]|nr:serine peptidase, family S28 [Aspergillus sp. HF37]
MFRDHAAFRALTAHFGGNPTKAEYTTILIDHWNSSVGTYQNWYWVDDQHYRPGGPVFVYDGGERNAELFVHSQFGNSSSILQQMLREFHGIGIIWEHRYYGESLPYPVSHDTPPEHLKYHTTKQALADIMIGGSYAGIRAAFTRNDYPETIYAAYASSAPVHAQVDMGVYYDQVYRGMIANGYANCVKYIQAALEYIDGQLASNETAAKIKQLFFGVGAETNSNGDFTVALAVFTISAAISRLVPKLTARPAPTVWRRLMEKSLSQSDFASWPIFTPLVNLNFGTNCKGLNETIPTSCELGRSIATPDAISWAWQYCTECGFFQVDNAGPRSLLSRYQSVEYYQGVCNQHFAHAARSDLLPPHPQAEALNEATRGWTIRPSNVYWTGGEFDPWRPMSTLSTEESAPAVLYSADIPACGAVREDRLFGYLMENAEHCYDFRTSYEPGAAARRTFIRALRTWLPCFEGQGGGTRA